MAKSKITLGEVGPLAAALNMALSGAKQQDTRIKLREALRALAQHGEHLDAEKQVLINQYAEKDDNGKPVVDGDAYVFGDKQADVDAAWKALNKTQVVVQHRLTLDDAAGLPADQALDALELLIGM
jgi:transcriptional regulator of heat shock response